MNTNEAIQKIKRVKGLYAYESDYEALDMAISALERAITPCGFCGEELPHNSLYDFCPYCGQAIDRRKDG